MSASETSVVLSGRVAIVTGASRGIGAAIAKRLSIAGAAVAAVARPSPDLDAVVAGIRQSGGTAVAVPANLSQPSETDHVVPRVIAELGPPDTLVNNAAIQRFRPVLDVQIEDYLEQLMVNLVAPFALARGVLPTMIARGQGWIINIASDLAYRSIATGSAYCASKRGLVALSECLQLEHRADGIHVSVIMPGSVSSGWDGRSPSDPETAGQMRVDDIADAVLWCCSRPADLRLDTLVMHPMIQDS